MSGPTNNNEFDQSCGNVAAYWQKLFRIRPTRIVWIDLSIEDGAIPADHEARLRKIKKQAGLLRGMGLALRASPWIC